MNVENMVDIQTPTELIHTKSPSEELWTAMFVKRQPDEWENIQFELQRDR